MAKKDEIKIVINWKIIALVIWFLLMIPLIYYNNFYLTLWEIITFILVIVFIVFKVKNKIVKKESHKKEEKRWVFEGSAGWLLFWLIVAFPIGIIYLILDMKKK